MRTVFDPATIEQGTGPSGLITGVLYFDFGEACFPVERWNDFAVVIASAWLEAVHRLEKSIDYEALVHFMEGPHYVAAIRISGDQIQLRCVERRLRGEHVQHEEPVKLGELGEQVRRLAPQVASRDWVDRRSAEQVGRRPAQAVDGHALGDARALQDAAARVAERAVGARLPAPLGNTQPALRPAC